VVAVGLELGARKHGEEIGTAGDALFGLQPKNSAGVSPMGILTTLQELEAIYGFPAEASIVKQVDVIIPQYRRLIEASPFAILATAGREGLDCSPRGDLPGFARIRDEKTLLLPDRKGTTG
jgi:Pyridoxamine 5'-phosphate oxidase